MTNKLYEHLKENWQKEISELQARRKAINDKRDEIYREYNELKKGIQEYSSNLNTADDLRFTDSLNPEVDENLLSNGTRKKQDRERAKLYAEIDDKLKQSREKQDNDPEFKESWQQRNARVTEQRAMQDADKIAEFDKKIQKIEEDFAIYSILCKQYYRDYYSILNNSASNSYLDPEQRQAYDAEAWQKHTAAKSDYQAALENQIEQDRIFAELAWDALYADNKLAADNLKDKYAKEDQLLYEQRQAERQKTHAYNAAYWEQIKHARTESDKNKKTQRKLAAETLKASRKETDQNTPFWQSHRASVKPIRAAQYKNDSNFFADLFKSIKNKVRNFRGMKIAKPITTSLWNVQLSANKTLLQDIPKAVTDINNDFLTGIEMIKPPPIKLWLKLFVVDYIDFSKIGPKEDIVKESKQLHQFWSNFIKSEWQNFRASSATDNNEFYTNYDKFIKDFYATWDASETQTKAKRSQEESNRKTTKKLARATIDEAKLVDIIANRKKIAALKGYEVNDDGVRTFAEDDLAIAQMRTAAEHNPRLAAALNNKIRGVAIRKRWYNFVFGIENFFNTIGSRTVSIGRNIQDASVYLYYRALNSGSSVYYVARRSAYAAYMFDRHILRPIWHSKILSNIKNVPRFIGAAMVYAIVGLPIQMLNAAFIASVYFASYATVAMLVVLHEALAALVVTALVPYSILLYQIGFLADAIAIISFTALSVSLWLAATAVLTIANSTAITLASIIATAIYLIEVPIAFTFVSIAKFGLMAFRATLNGLEDLMILSIIAISTAPRAVYRLMQDTAIFMRNALVDGGRLIMRGIADLGHIIKENLYDNILVFLVQGARDFATNASRNINAALNAINISWTKFRFATYVSLRALGLRINYAFGTLPQDAIYYSGRLVVSAHRLGSDTYLAVADMATQAINPAQKQVNKAFESAKYTAVNVPANIARLTDDYIAYPITYAYHRGGIAISRAAWDGYINIWRGLQGVCTSGIRGFHDLALDTKHNVATKATNIGFGIYEKGVDAKHTAIKAGHMVRGGIEHLNFTAFLEKDADKLFEEFQKQQANVTDPRSNDPRL